MWNTSVIEAAARAMIGTHHGDFTIAHVNGSTLATAYYLSFRHILVLDEKLAKFVAACNLAFFARGLLYGHSRTRVVPVTVCDQNKVCIGWVRTLSVYFQVLGVLRVAYPGVDIDCPRRTLLICETNNESSVTQP